jgi:membrane-bound metal-dependent hydrolase YbcI (DUF457 family)
MPSPIGHALAGLAVASAADRILPSRYRDPAVSGVLIISCVALAVAPDLDLIYPSSHRTMTHSVFATGLVTIVAAAVTGWVTGRVDWRLAITCGFAHASHILVDWMGQDLATPAGLQILWPFSDRWFISGWEIFRATQRHDPFSVATMIHNLKTGALELAIFVPLVLALRFAGRSGKDEGQARGVVAQEKSGKTGSAGEAREAG